MHRQLPGAVEVGELFGSSGRRVGKQAGGDTPAPANATWEASVRRICLAGPTRSAASNSHCLVDQLVKALTSPPRSIRYMGCGGAAGSNRKFSSVAPAPSVYTGGCCSSSSAPSGDCSAAPLLPAVAAGVEPLLPLLLPLALGLLPLLLLLPPLLLLAEEEYAHTSSTNSFCSFQACFIGRGRVG